MRRLGVLLRLRRKKLTAALMCKFRELYERKLWRKTRKNSDIKAWNLGSINLGYDPILVNMIRPTTGQANKFMEGSLVRARLRLVEVIKIIDCTPNSKINETVMKSE